MKTKDKIEKILKTIVALLIAGRLEEVEHLISGDISAKDMDEAISEYSEQIGANLSLIPEEGYRENNLSLHEEGDPIGEDGKLWSCYVLPLWFDNEKSELVLETIFTENEKGLELIIKNIFVM